MKNYQSVCDPEETTKGPDRVKAAKYFQKPQQSEFSIHIGSFEDPKVDYLSDPIQSFYKQFVSSEEAIYFFKYETKNEKQLNDYMNPPRKQTTFSSNQPQSVVGPAKSGMSAKTGIDSLSDGNSDPIVMEKMPILYKLSPYECKAERVMVNGNVIRLPFDSNSN